MATYTPEQLAKLDPSAICNASPRHIQSVLEQLIATAQKSQKLAQRVARLNPAAGEIGAGMLASLVEDARGIA